MTYYTLTFQLGVIKIPPHEDQQSIVMAKLLIIFS